MELFVAKENQAHSEFTQEDKKMTPSELAKFAIKSNEEKIKLYESLGLKRFARELGGK